MSLRRVALLSLILGGCTQATAQPENSTSSESALAVHAVSEAESAAYPAKRKVVVPQHMAFGYRGKLEQGGWIRGKAPMGSKAVQLNGEPLPLTKDGWFFAGFDRDEDAEARLVATLTDGREIPLKLTIAPRAWDIERVNVAKRPGGGSSEEWWKQREPEWLAIRDARAKETDSQGWKQDFVWPVTGRISGRFGRQRIYRGEPGSYHSGLDIAPGNGVPFVSPADGTVVLARTGFSLEGGIVIVDHGNGLNSAFIHLSQLAVAEGESVAQGQKLGNVGASGRATGPHLHWSLTWRGKRLDPLLFLPPMP